MAPIKAGLGGWGLDARFVLRSLRRSPGYALTAVVVLAGAVAVNASVFGFVRGTLLAKPTYPGADRMVVIWGSNTVDGQRRDVLSGPNLMDFARETTSLEALAAFHVDLTTLTSGEHPEPIDETSVSVDFFRVVPVKAALGRVFDERERNSGGQESVLLSWAFFRDRLGADPAWVGRSISIEGTPRTIVGVLPEGFEFLVPSQLWLPLHDDVLAADNRSRIHYNAVGRLKPGATAADVTRDLSGAMRAGDRAHRHVPRLERAGRADARGVGAGRAPDPVDGVGRRGAGAADRAGEPGHALPHPHAGPHATS